MKKPLVLLMMAVLAMHLLPHTDHSGGEATAECLANVCDKKPVPLTAKKEGDEAGFEAAAMDSEQIAFDYGESG